MKARRASKRTDAGMTLIELTLAMGIFATALVLMLGSFLSISTLTSVTQKNAEALTQMSGVIEEVQGMSLSELIEEYDQPVPKGFGKEAVFELACTDEEGNRIKLPPKNKKDEDAVHALPEPVHVEISLRWRNKRGVEMSRHSVAAVWR